MWGVVHGEQVSPDLIGRHASNTTTSTELLANDPVLPAGTRGAKTLRVDGKPFFPVGMYTLQDRGGQHDKVLAEARAAGFNCTFFYAYNDREIMPLLDAAARNGIRAFTYVTNPYKMRRGESTRDDIARDLVKRVGHPALLGWYLVDEPEGIGELPAQKAEWFYRLVKQLDSKHPCAMVVMSPAAAREYGKHTDIMWVDPYPIPDRPVTFVADTIAKTIAAVPDKPVWAVLQAFDWNVWRNGKIDKVHRPTPEEARCMTYLALVHGARGVIYWAHSATKYNIRDYPDHWEYMKKLAGELRDLSPVLLEAPSTLKVEVAPPEAPIDTAVREHAGDHYVIAVNREPTTCSVTMSLPGITLARPAEVMFEGRLADHAGGSWSDEFEPLAVHVYRGATQR
jgi:hypothetical protein